MNRADAREAGLGLPAPLLRLHRHSRANLLVTGGTRARRLAVVRAFHQRGPYAHEPFVAIDCARDEARLARTLEQWLLATGPQAAGDGATSAERIGVLYLESIAELSAGTQRLLLVLAHRLQGQADSRPPGPARLMAGDRGDLVRAAESGRFSRALADHLDKIRVNLGRRRSRGAA